METFQSPNVCIYCGTPKVTKEHIWGRWSRRHALAQFGRSEHKIVRYPNKDFNAQGIASRGALTRPGSYRSQTLKIACVKCNSGWMSDNIDTIIPLLKRMNYGYWGDISESDLRNLARWIAQFTMSYEFADRETVCVSQPERSAFACGEELSDNWAIAIGNALPLVGNDPVYHRALGVDDNKNGREKRSKIAIFMFGMLFCACVYSETHLSPEVFRAFSNVQLVTIHPPTGQVVRKPRWQHHESDMPLIINDFTLAMDSGMLRMRCEDILR